MKYGIVNKEHKVVIMDDDLERLKGTVATFMPLYRVEQIEAYGDEHLEQAYDGCWYELGYAPVPPEEVLVKQAKGTREEAVNSITVTVDGMVFDGDEKSQERMSRKLNVARANDISMDTSLDWVLADNTVAQVTLRQLAKAALLAGQKQSELWTLPYKKNKKEKVYY